MPAWTLAKPSLARACSPVPLVSPGLHDALEHAWTLSVVGVSMAPILLQNHQESKKKVKKYNDL